MHSNFTSQAKTWFPRQLEAMVLILCIATGCKFAKQLSKPTVLTSSDGKVQLTVPFGWRQDSSLNEQASIGASNRLVDAYVIIWTDDKQDFVDDMTLDKFTETSRKQRLERVSEAELSPVSLVTINGREGRQYEAQGVVDNMKIFYLITTVETATSYHQIFTWTVRSRIELNRNVLRQVTESFRELR